MSENRQKKQRKCRKTDTKKDGFVAFPTKHKIGCRPANKLNSINLIENQFFSVKKVHVSDSWCMIIAIFCYIRHEPIKFNIMSFNGTEGDPITIAQGAALTANFRAAYPLQIKARFFGKDLLEDILKQNGAKGIRFYFGLNANNQLELVICAADQNENDILGIVGDYSYPCPPSCSSRNALNS